MEDNERIEAAARRLEEARQAFEDGTSGAGLRVAEALEALVREGGYYDGREGEIAPCDFCGDPGPEALPCLTCARAGL